MNVNLVCVSLWRNGVCWGILSTVGTESSRVACLMLGLARDPNSRVRDFHYYVLGSFETLWLNSSFCFARNNLTTPLLSPFSKSSTFLSFKVPVLNAVRSSQRGFNDGWWVPFAAEEWSGNGIQSIVISTNLLNLKYDKCRVKDWTGLINIWRSKFETKKFKLSMVCSLIERCHPGLLDRS
jgi:hypothetical protein